MCRLIGSSFRSITDHLRFVDISSMFLLLQILLFQVHDAVINVEVIQASTLLADGHRDDVQPEHALYRDYTRFNTPVVNPDVAESLYRTRFTASGSNPPRTVHTSKEDTWYVERRISNSDPVYLVISFHCASGEGRWLSCDTITSWSHDKPA